MEEKVCCENNKRVLSPIEGAISILEDRISRTNNMVTSLERQIFIPVQSTTGCEQGNQKFPETLYEYLYFQTRELGKVNERLEIATKTIINQLGEFKLE